MATLDLKKGVKGLVSTFQQGGVGGGRSDDSNTSQPCANAIEALFSVSYAVKICEAPSPKTVVRQPMR